MCVWRCGCVGTKARVIGRGSRRFRRWSFWNGGGFERVVRNRVGFFYVDQCVCFVSGD